MTKGPIICFFDGRSTARHRQELLPLVAGEMKQFFEGIALLIDSGSLTQKRRVNLPNSYWGTSFKEMFN